MQRTGMNIIALTNAEDTVFQRIQRPRRRYDLPQSYFLGRARQMDSATGTANGEEQASAEQISENFGKIRGGNIQCDGYFMYRAGSPLRLQRQKHAGVKRHLSWTAKQHFIPNLFSRAPLCETNNGIVTPLIRYVDDDGHELA